MADLKEFIDRCPACLQCKRSTGAKLGKLMTILSERPFQLVEVDITGPLTTTTGGNKYIVVFIDHFTKWVEAFPTHRIHTKQIVKLLVDNIITRFGIPEKLLLDNGPQFNNEDLKQVCSSLGTNKKFSTIYHPETNGMVERMNRTLKEMVRKCVNTNQKNWDEVLPWVTMAYNSARHVTTKFSPHFLLFGCQTRLPIDLVISDSEVLNNSNPS